VRIGLVYSSVGRGTVDWSGVPAGLAGGLRAIGHEPVLVPADIPYTLRRATDLLALARYRRRGLGLATAPAVRGRSAAAARRLRAAEPLAGVVLMGTAFEIPRSVPFVTYDDMTVPQFARLTGLPRRLEAAWAARQARALRDARRCCVTADWVADSLADDYGLGRERIEVVGLGANIDLAEPGERDWSVPRFLFIGADWERKGGPRLVPALRRVRERHPEATLDIVGGAPPLDEPGVTTHGFLDMRTPEGMSALLALYRRATCFVMPSRFEPTGIVHAEAGRAGLPAIGTTVGGAATAIGPGGTTVAPGDDEALVAAMLALADPAEARRRGALAREHAQRFTWENVARRLVAHLGDEARSGPGHERP
jgi:glycosyltransferase involved in cell wall biosynthesis